MANGRPSRSWLGRVRETFDSASTPLRVAMLGAPLVLVVAGAAALVLWPGGDQPLPDPGSPTYAVDIAARLDVEPSEITSGVVEGLLGSEASPEERRRAVASLAEALAGPTAGAQAGGTPDEVVLNALVRRLGERAAEAGSSAELIELLISEIDPDGSIDSPEKLHAAVVAWAASHPANVLHIVAPSAATVGPLLGVASDSYEEVAAELEQHRAAADVLDLPLAGVAGLQPLTVPGVTWEADPATRSLVFTGTTTLFDRPAELLALLHWGQATTPSFSVGLRTDGWSLDGFGVRGPLADYVFPELTFVLAGEDLRLPLASLPPGASSFLASTYAANAETVSLASGVNLLAELPLDRLPVEALGALGLRDDNSIVGLSGSLGADFDVMSGGSSSNSTALRLAATLPPIEPPSFPDWLTQSDGASWSLTLAYADGAFAFGLAGTLEARLDGRQRPFAVTADLTADGGAGGTLRGQLLEPWDNPFGLGWLTFNRLSLEVSLDSADTAASFTSDVQIAGHAAALSFELHGGDASSSVDLTATLDRLTAAEVIAFLAEQLGATAPPAAPDLALSDIVLNVRTGEQSSVAFAATARVASQPVDVLLSTIAEPGGPPSVVLGVQLPDWALTDALPELQGTLLEEIRFPPTALVLSTMDAELDASELSPPVRTFFQHVAATGASGSAANYQLTLRPGLSMFGSISFAGTDLEAPMEALGFSGASFPVVGTLPGRVIGIGGASAAGLADLALSVALPPIQPPGSPEWFRSGQVAFEITGQPSLSLEGSLSVVIDGDELTFLVGSQFARSGSGVTVSLFGALEADRPWVQPFSIDWLTLNRVAIELSIDPIGSVGLGFAGSMVLGEKDIDAAIKLEVSPAGVPTNFILAGASAAGVSTNDLILLQRQIAGAANPRAQPLALASDQPRITIRNVEFRFAPKPSPVLGVEAGFVLAGDAYVAFDAGEPETRFGSLDFRITESGLFAQGHLTAYDMGPLAWDDIDLDVEVSRADQHFIFDGAAEVFDARTQISIDVSTGSIFFAGRKALEDLRLIVAAFEVFVDDPVGSVDKLPYLFEQLGVPQPPWVRDLTAALQQLADAGQRTSTAALDGLLNGGSISLVAVPVGGEDRVCELLTPIEVDGRCYTVPPVESEGEPLGGAALACPLTAPQTYSGRCYTTKPSSTTACPLWAPQLHTDGRCYTTKPSSTRVCVITCTTVKVAGVPDGGTAKVTTNIPGIPSGGVPKDACPVTTPIKVGGRCYTIPPGELVGTPRGGADLVCGALVPTYENGRCWTLSPSQAAAGLRVPGLCTTYANLECSWDQLVSRDIRPLLVGGLTRRLSSWK